jgi:hypothetical protein
VFSTASSRPAGPRRSSTVTTRETNPPASLIVPAYDFLRDLRATFAPSALWLLSLFFVPQLSFL